MVIKMEVMKHGSLFSGIGGFDLAAEWMGWENVFHCEYNPFGRRVLEYYWPNAISYEDITKTDFTSHANQIDILTGGFPCQPYSVSGKRLGKEDERHLWPEMLRAIREISPRYVVGENVRGLLSWNGGVVFDEVQSDLEVEGYDVLPFLLPAAGVNAPHRRYRVWFIAYNHRKFGESEERELPGESMPGRCREKIQGVVSSGIASNASIENDRRRVGSKSSGQKSKSGSDTESNVNPNSSKVGSKRRAESGGVRAIRATANQQLAGFCELSQWEEFPSQPPVCGGNDGLPSGLDGITVSKWMNESVAAFGNAIVPQLAYRIFKAIEETELIITTK